MKFVINALILGDEELPNSFVKSIVIWDRILRSLEAQDKLDVEHLASQLTNVQWEFENVHHDRSVAQEIMVIAGIARYYMGDLGEGRGGKTEREPEKADLIYLSLKNSSCSMEIKSFADSVAKYYGITPDYLRKA